MREKKRISRDQSRSATSYSMTVNLWQLTSDLTETTVWSQVLSPVVRRQLQSFYPRCQSHAPNHFLSSCRPLEGQFLDQSQPPRHDDAPTSGGGQRFVKRIDWHTATEHWYALTSQTHHRVITDQTDIPLDSAIVQHWFRVFRSAWLRTWKPTVQRGIEMDGLNCARHFWRESLEATP